jgi:hypothetical protein
MPILRIMAMRFFIMLKVMDVHLVIIVMNGAQGNDVIWTTTIHR